MRWLAVSRATDQWIEAARELGLLLRQPDG